MSVTESGSLHTNLEQKDIQEILTGINQEDQTVAKAVQIAIPQLEKLCTAIVNNMDSGGRLFYMGAGTSGRLGIVDASECPPTFGVPHELVVGIIAGGDTAIRKAVEFAEDDTTQGWVDLMTHNINAKDSVVGIAASGGTPYVINAMNRCRDNGITTGCITCNPNSALAKAVDFPVEVIVGPEYITGSTRMKAGTAQKLTLNMLSTTVMIKLGKVVGSRMVDMQLSNKKLIDRGTKMVMESTGLLYEEAYQLLIKTGSVRNAIDLNSINK